MMHSSRQTPLGDPFALETSFDTISGLRVCTDWMQGTCRLGTAKCDTYHPSRQDVEAARTSGNCTSVPGTNEKRWADTLHSKAYTARAKQELVSSGSRPHASQKLSSVLPEITALPSPRVDVAHAREPRKLIIDNTNSAKLSLKTRASESPDVSPITIVAQQHNNSGTLSALILSQRSSSSVSTNHSADAFVPVASVTDTTRKPVVLQLPSKPAHIDARPTSSAYLLAETSNTTTRQPAQPSMLDSRFAPQCPSTASIPRDSAMLGAHPAWEDRSALGDRPTWGDRPSSGTRQPASSASMLSSKHAEVTSQTPAQAQNSSSVIASKWSTQKPSSSGNVSTSDETDAGSKLSFSGPKKPPVGPRGKNRKGGWNSRN